MPTTESAEPRDELAADAHRRTAFGQWYYRDGIHPLADYPVFGELGRVQPGMHAATREALRDAAEQSLVELRRGLSVLATIGSTAPFVGLFGTTFGIIDAFAIISQTGSAGMSVISGSIAEALYTTALGLLVALPAVWAYNYALSRVDSFAADLDRARHQLVAFLLKTA